jgi:hypothetical protein
VTTHARKGTPVAQRTPLFHDRFGGMRIVKIPRVMIRRLEVGPFGIVTFRATERWVDLAVAHKTIGHLWHVGGCHMI